MKNIAIVTWYTIKEAMARKVFIFFAVISALVIVFTAVILGITDVTSLAEGFAKGNGMSDIGFLISKLEIAIVSPLAALGLLLAIFASSSFIPIMLEKGNIDLLLSKPVSRTQLLWGKYFGGTAVVFLNIAILIIGVWLDISFKFNYWQFTFLWSILIITFTFAVLYSIIVLFGVLTRSSMLGMMIAYLIFLVISPLLRLGHYDLHQVISSDFWRSAVDGAYYILPKTAELMKNVIEKLASGEAIESFQPLWSSFLFLLAMMGISTYAFNKKDF